jgi:hypothetical protein
MASFNSLYIKDIYELKLYIPRISIFEDFNSVFEIFRTCTQNFGFVSRVDFVELPGNTQESKDYQSAFVYLKCPIHKGGVCGSLYQALCKNEPFKIYPHGDKRYWLILNNTKPVPETKLNIHQIVENAKILETKVKELEDRIKYLEDSVASI